MTVHEARQRLFVTYERLENAAYLILKDKSVDSANTMRAVLFDLGVAKRQYAEAIGAQKK